MLQPAVRVEQKRQDEERQLGVVQHVRRAGLGIMQHLADEADRVSPPACKRVIVEHGAHSCWPWRKMSVSVRPPGFARFVFRKVANSRKAAFAHFTASLVVCAFSARSRRPTA